MIFETDLYELIIPIRIWNFTQKQESENAIFAIVGCWLNAIEVGMEVVDKMGFLWIHKVGFRVDPS